MDTSEWLEDSVVREAVALSGLGQFTRDVAYYEKRERGFNMIISSGLVLYKSADECIQLHGDLVIGRKYSVTRPNIVSVRDWEKFEDKEAKLNDKLSEQRKARHERAMDAWRAKYPTEKARKSMLGRMGMPMHEGVVMMGPGGNGGILVRDYRDKKKNSIWMTSLSIQYVDEKAVMNVNERPIPADVLLPAMDALKDKHSVDIGYLYGKELHDFYASGAIGGTASDLGPKDREYQNNIFQRSFQGPASVEDIVTAVTSVYAAGQDFIAGVAKYVTAKDLEEQIAREATTTRLNSAFGL